MFDEVARKPTSRRSIDSPLGIDCVDIPDSFNLLTRPESILEWQSRWPCKQESNPPSNVLVDNEVVRRRDGAVSLMASMQCLAARHRRTPFRVQPWIRAQTFVVDLSIHTSTDCLTALNNHY